MTTSTAAAPVATPDLSRIAQDLQIRKIHVEAVVQLLDEANTVPFITRYRKERTGGLNEEVIRRIQTRVGQLRQLAERKQTILKSIEGQGKLTEELRRAITDADSPKRLEDLYLPYKPKKRSLASEAREKGLEPLASAIWARDPVAANLQEIVAATVNPEKGLNTPEDVLGGVKNILAEVVSELADLRGSVRLLIWDTALIVAGKHEGLPEGKGQEYKGYFEFKESVQTIPPHRILAINRGEKEGALKVKLEYDPARVRAAAQAAVPLGDHPHQEFLNAVVEDALARLVLPAIEREVRRELTDFALDHAVSIFARNLRSLLLQPPLRGKRILGIDPGLRTGCKLAALDEHGNIIEHEVIYPHAMNRKDEAFRRLESRMRLEEMIRKHHLAVVAIGNGTACRETEKLVSELIADLEARQFGGEPKIDLPAPPPQAVTAPDAAPAARVAAQPEMPGAESQGPPAAVPIMPAEETVIAQTVPPAPEAVAPQSPPAESAPHAPSDVGLPSDSLPAPAAVEAPPPPPEPTNTPTPTLPLASETAPAAASGETHGAAAEVSPTPELAAPGDSPTSPGVAGEGTGVKGEGADQPDASSSSPSPPVPVGTLGQGEQKAAPPPKRERPQPELPKIDFAALPPAPADLAYVVVNEAGASDYSASDVAREEFPNFDATVRSTISIGRRLQDPLAELVKIDPQHVGVGLYQHDVKAKHLRDSLEGVIESCVNHVGVDLNTASVPLLRHVSGFNALVARELVEYRKQNGPFKSREQLQAVPGVGPQRFTQAAGFLKIPGGEEPLDETWIHPESYPIARKILEDVGLTAADLRDRAKLGELREKLNKVHAEVYAERFATGIPTVKDIFDALAKPSRDPREDLPPPVFRKNILKIEDLQTGMELKGTVLNVVDFGAFVDIGLKDSGLVHISQMANRYIKNPYEVVSVGDVVTVWVRVVDMERRHVSLTMIPAGAERRPPERRQGPPPQREPGEQREQREPRPPRQPRREGPPRDRAPAPAGQGQGGPHGQGHGQGRGQGQDRGQGQGQDRGRGRRDFRRDRPPQGQGQGQQGPAPPPPPPRRPAGPPKPLPKLSKDAITGKAPLFSFGELAAFFKAKEGPDEPAAAPAPPPAPPPEAKTDEPAPASEHPPTS